jgi:hypothetical protein
MQTNFNPQKKQIPYTYRRTVSPPNFAISRNHTTSLLLGSRTTWHPSIQDHLLPKLHNPVLFPRWADLVGIRGFEIVYCELLGGGGWKG